MFLIKENKFITDGRVKYEDELGNKLMILAEKDGSSFKIKCRPALGYDIDVVYMQFPYDEDGINFHFSADKDFEITDAERNMLTEVVKISENWICMMRCITTLLKCDISQMAANIPDEKDTEKAAEMYADYLIDELSNHQEMEHFVKLYAAVMAGNNPAEIMKKREMLKHA